MKYDIKVLTTFKRLRKQDFSSLMRFFSKKMLIISEVTWKVLTSICIIATSSIDCGHSWLKALTAFNIVFTRRNHAAMI